MCSVLVMVGDVLLDQPKQMTLTQNDDVIEQFAAARPVSSSSR
jgi:hypothetical protein